jgi:hypothetical protein
MAPSTDDILKKYGSKIESQMKGYNGANQGSGKTTGKKKFSQSYEKFRGSMLPEFNRYEKWCKSLGNIFKIKVAEKDRTRIQKSIDIAHLNITPSEVLVCSTMLLFLTLFSGILFSMAIWLLAYPFPTMFLFMTFVLAVFLFFYSSKAPERLSMKWRLKASSQMVPAILYIVVYMKHTSNFEKAISFASEHLQV